MDANRIYISCIYKLNLLYFYSEYPPLYTQKSLVQVMLTHSLKLEIFFALDTPVSTL